ncbi:DUF3168 domain-containing protein [Zavarzinia compransoris]|uniref:DUF3168 domain-containing protein n=1 Tax=Zavarzinia marina TaxID=2911065 RepID=UPI001F449038|nr:DUF3168 domain-containing protein [Zavarzinia marina]MCF4166475.1 DUF3168 domain-containing protein [Zavarzinia marina]
MTPDASLAVQQAVYARLAADTDLAALIGTRLHDRRPEGGLFPHVVLGEAEVFPDDSATRTGQLHVLTLHVWSRYRGRAEVKQILAVLAAAFHRLPLDLGADLRCVALRVAHAGVLDDGDGVTSHGILRLRAVTETALPHTS